MSKRRKVWWIVGGVVGFVVLYSATAFLVSWYSPIARFERVVGEIVEEHGLEFKTTPPLIFIGYPGGGITNYVYEGDPISKEDEKRILAQLKEAFPSATSDSMTLGDDMRYPLFSDEASFEIHSFSMFDESIVRDLTIVFDDHGLVIDGTSPASQLTVTRNSETDRWSFLKNLWPW